jgi:hypothetical protein
MIDMKGCSSDDLLRPCWCSIGGFDRKLVAWDCYQENEP